MVTTNIAKNASGKRETTAEAEKRIKVAFPHGFDTMTVKTTDKAKYHEKDAEIEVGKVVGEKMVKAGFAKEVK